MSMTTTSGTITESDWVKGIGFSVASSIIGGASKLAIRKSWLMEAAACQRFLPLDSSSRHGEDEYSSSIHFRKNEHAHGNSLLRDERLTLSDQQQDIVSCRDSLHCARADTRVPPSRQHERIIIGTKFTQAHVLRGMGALGMTTLNPLTTVIAMNYASPSILAPFSGLTLVWIVLFSPVVVQETPSRRQLTACAFILAGEVVVAAFGDHRNDNDVTVSDVVS